MENFFVSVGLLLASLVSTFGWGRLVASLCYGNRPLSVAYNVTLGLGILVLIGGFLNLLRIAHPTTLEALYALGLGAALVFAARAIRRDRARYSTSGPLRRLGGALRSCLIHGDALPWLVLLAVTGYFTATLMPTAAFNFHDDFHKYLSTPIRMLQTGTLGGGPFEVVGRDHLGSQSFLQAFVLTRFTPAFINGFDYVFCFLVAGLLLNDVGRKVQVHWFFRTVAVLTFVLIDPQYVNISALYSGALLVLAILYAALLFADIRDGSNVKTLTVAAIPIGLFLASLMSLKATFIPFALLLSAMLAVGFLWAVENRVRVVVASGVATLTAGAVLVPWSVISTNNYGKIIAIGLARVANVTENGGEAAVDWERLGDLFLSNEDLYYGGWLPGYNFGILLMAIAALMAFVMLWRTGEPVPRRYLAISLCLSGAAVIAYLFNAYLFAVKSGRVDLVVRYFMPIFIAVVPATILLLGRRFWPQLTPTRMVAPATNGTLAFLALLVLLGGMFVGTFADRVEQLARHRNDLSFALGKNEFYRSYNRLSLSTATSDRLQEIQSKTRPDVAIMSWVSAPFQLDFRRNPILTMELPDFVLDGAEQPFKGDAKAFGKFLKDSGVRYVLWQSGGYGMRSERSLRRKLRSPAQRKYAQAYLDLRALVAALETESRILYKDNSVVLFDIGTKSSDVGSGRRP